MGFSVILETEKGVALARVEDPRDSLSAILPDYAETSFAHLRFIDPYGNTVFNPLQMTPFLEEWRQLADRVQSAEAKAVYDNVEKLALRCQQDAHQYLRFLGD